MKKPNPVNSPFSESHKLDEIDRVISQRELDRNPKYMAQLYKELGLTPFVAKISTHPDIRPITPLWRSRSMNFYEAASVGNFTREETRIGMIVAGLISCCRIQGLNDTLSPVSNTIDSFIPVFLPNRCKYGDMIADSIKPQEVGMVNDYVKMFLHADPNRTKLKNSAVSVYLRDACLSWVTSGDQEVINFMINHDDARTKAILDTGLAAVPEEYRSNILTLYVTALNNYNNTFYTKWGVARSFKRNHAQAIKNIFT